MRRKASLRVFVVALLCILLMPTVLVPKMNALGWSNGGYSDGPSNPKYGTHDWVAQHALDWLPSEEKQFILDNLLAYLYGTELPDNGAAPDGIGDSTEHHVYYWSNTSLQDDASAARASDEFNDTLVFLSADSDAMAAKSAGIMSHYLMDVGVFGHVMGSATDWGSETHHSDYESYVQGRTSNYSDEFNSYLFFDGALEKISAYNATLKLAFDTTFDTNGALTCTWMDQHYNWSDPTFRNRAGESLNLAANILTDVLHTLYLGHLRRAGDTNLDGIVDVNDLFTIAKAFGYSSGEPEYKAEADTNEDGKIDTMDLHVLQTHYGKDPQ